MSEIHTFDPVLFSKAENEFLLENLGEPTVVALRKVTFPVNPRAVKPILDRVNELQDLEKHEGISWGGIEPLKEKIRAYIREDAKWALDHKRNKKAPRYPSLSSYDSRGRAHRGGPGSDSARVRTYFGPAGERIPFEIQLVPDNIAPWVAPGFTEAPMSALLYEDPKTNRIECRVKVGEGICGHTESYKPESRSSHTAARARMSKHLRKAIENVDDHRELHTSEFGE
jgi:hypothetical protein